MTNKVFDDQFNSFFGDNKNQDNGITIHSIVCGQRVPFVLTLDEINAAKKYENEKPLFFGDSRD